MKTIAITIDEPTLETLDGLLKTNGAPGKNRSQIVRRALREYLARLEQTAEEKREAEVFHRNRRRLKQQAVALIKEQAKP
jgi:metal-responsive CopG/Arc/MetJ family transcriptional regulator